MNSIIFHMVLDFVEFNHMTLLFLSSLIVARDSTVLSFRGLRWGNLLFEDLILPFRFISISVDFVLSLIAL